MINDSKDDFIIVISQGYELELLKEWHVLNLTFSDCIHKLHVLFLVKKYNEEGNHP